VIRVVPWKRCTRSGTSGYRPFSRRLSARQGWVRPALYDGARLVRSPARRQRPPQGFPCRSGRRCLGCGAGPLRDAARPYPWDRGENRDHILDELMPPRSQSRDALREVVAFWLNWPDPAARRGAVALLARFESRQRSAPARDPGGTTGRRALLPPPLTPTQRRAFEYSAMEGAMSHHDAAVRHARHTPLTVSRTRAFPEEELEGCGCNGRQA
jgi:hypothetical protein